MGRQEGPGRGAAQAPGQAGHLRRDAGIHPLLEPWGGLRRFDLAQSWRGGMPHYLTHPPYTHSLTKRHGEFVLEKGASAAGDAIALGTHTGTPIDALCHYALNGRLHGGAEAAGLQDWSGGIARHGAETLELILRRGIVPDVARREDAAHWPLPAERGGEGRGGHGAARRRSAAIQR